MSLYSSSLFAWPAQYLPTIRQRTIHTDFNVKVPRSFTPRKDTKLKRNEGHDVFRAHNSDLCISFD